MLILLVYFGRKINWVEVWQAVNQTHKGLLLVGALLISLTYIARAFRWQVLIKPLTRARWLDLFAATCIGFGAIFIVGRAGELARPTYLALRSRTVKTSQAFVTIAVERLFDMATTILLFACALMFLRSSGVDAASFARVRQAGFVLLVGAVVGLIGLIVFHLRAGRVLAWAERKLNLVAPTHEPLHPTANDLRLDEDFAARDFDTAAPRPAKADGLSFVQRAGRTLINVLRQLETSLSVLTDGRSLLATIFWTSLTWGLIVAANVCVMRAFDLPLGALQVIFVMGCALVGSLVPTPGGAAGAFEAATMGGLYLLGINREVGLAAAIVLKFVSFAPAVFFAAYFLLTGGVKLKNLRASNVDSG